MPTYDYECKDCGKKFSLFLSISEKDKAKCTGCASLNVRQLFTGFLYSKPGGEDGGSGSACGSCSGGSCSTCSGC